MGVWETRLDTGHCLCDDAGEHEVRPYGFRLEGDLL